MTGAAITKTVHELSLLIGTEQDPTSVLEDVAGFAPTLGGLVPACVPDAEESMWRFLGSTETLRQKFSSAADKTEMRATKVALISVRAHAADLYRRLGLDGAAWSEVPASARPACRDLPSIAARVTWDVRHLANLIGSDNGKDAQDYLIEISALGAAMADLVGECHPGAVPAMAEFSGAVEQLSSTYRPGSIAAEVEADKAALGNLREKGRALYSAVGVSAASWDVIPSTER